MIEGELEAPKAGKRSISPAGVRFIGGWEGFRGKLYDDPLGHCTIGYGHLVHLGRCNGTEPARFKRGLSQDQALDLLNSDVKRYEDAVNASVKVPLNQQQFDALVSFTYNVGPGNLASSTLLRRLNRKEYAAVPSELMRWTNRGLAGLVRRRRAEGVLFREGRHEEMVESPDSQGGPEQRRDIDIQEGPEAATATAEAGTAEVNPLAEEGAEEGRHEPTGENPQDIGETTDEPDDEDEDGLEGPGDPLRRAIRIAVDMGLVITSTNTGGHSPNSFHFRTPFRTVVVRGKKYEVGRAADVAKAGNPDDLYREYFKKIQGMAPTELFYDPMGFSMKNGVKANFIVGGHRDHIHVAF